jgi:CubicO group peptidase (beta-lactamase class C family)
MADWPRCPAEGTRSERIRFVIMTQTKPIQGQARSLGVMERAKKQELGATLCSLLDGTVRKNKHLSTGLSLIHSDKHDLHWKCAVGKLKKTNSPLAADQSYHIASIGKSFTATLVSMLVDQGRLGFDDHVSLYLPSQILDGLYVYKGTDYSQQVEIQHLLGHSSGIADYIEERPKGGKSVLQLIVDEPERFWTPLQTIDFARQNLQPHFPPGKGFHYNDTGYQLLGLIIEHITGAPMHESLHRLILGPLEMKHTHQPFYSEPEQETPQPLAEFYVDGVEVSEFKSISADWAGGGIASTAEDLLKFHHALVHNQLITAETLQRMQSWRRMRWGMDYGHGLVRLRFKDLFFLLPRSFNSWGNFGSTACFMFHNPEMDLYMVGAFNQSKFVSGQVRFMIRLLNAVSKHLKRD